MPLSRTSRGGLVDAAVLADEAVYAVDGTAPAAAPADPPADPRLRVLGVWNGDPDADRLAREDAHAAALSRRTIADATRVRARWDGVDWDADTSLALASPRGLVLSAPGGRIEHLETDADSETLRAALSGPVRIKARRRARGRGHRWIDIVVMLGPRAGDET